MFNKLENDLARAIKARYPSMQDICELIDNIKANYDVRFVDDAVIWCVYYTTTVDNFELSRRCHQYRQKHGSHKFFALLYHAFEKSHWIDMGKFITYCARW